MDRSEIIANFVSFPRRNYALCPNPRRRNSRGKLEDISSSSSTQLLNGKMGVNSDQSTVEVEVQIVDANKKFTRLGFGLAGATFLISVLTSDDKKSKRKPRNEHTEFKKKSIDLNKDSLQPLRPGIEGQQLMVDASVRPNDDTDTSKGISYPVTGMVRKRKMAAVRDPSTMQTETENSSVENPSNVSPHVEKVGTIVASILPPPAAKRTPGLLGRIFQKPGAGRLTDIREVLKQTDTARDFRHVVVEILLLTSSMPRDIFLEANLAMGSSIIGKNHSQDPEKLSICLDEVQEISSLNDQQAANAFAEVVSAMLVVLVDHAVEMSNIGANETVTVSALDLVSEFMKAASDIFGMKFNGTKIDPVQYNGKAKKSQLEHLYYVFSKTMTFESLLPFVGLGSPLESSEKTDTANLKKLTVEEKMTFIQQAFAIKENKRINIEQKALKEKFMNSGGMGGFGDSLNLMDMWRKPESMDSLLAEISENSGSQNLEGYPDVGNLDPKVLITTLKAGLKDGSITAKEVIEFEKLVGIDINQVLKAAGSQGGGKSEDVAEMLDLLRELAKVKGP